VANHDPAVGTSGRAAAVEREPTDGHEAAFDLQEIEVRPGGLLDLGYAGSVAQNGDRVYRIEEVVGRVGDVERSRGIGAGGW